MSGDPDPKPAKRIKARRSRTDDEREAAGRFKTVVLALDRGCIVHADPDECAGPLQAHHVVSQQAIRKAGRLDLLWDPANGAAACEAAHDRHTRAVERITRGRLPARCITFAVEHGFEGVLSRYYPSGS